MRLFSGLVVIFLTVLLAACGGSNREALANAAAATPPTTSPTLSLALVDGNGAESNSISLTDPLTAKATLRDGAGNPMANTIVTFAAAGTLTSLSPSSGKTLTNAAGVASVTLSAKDLQTVQSQAGTADTLIATAAVGATALEATKSFQIGAAAVTLSMVTPGVGTTSLVAYGTTLIKVDVLANGRVYGVEPITVNFSSNCASANLAVLPASASTTNGRAQVLYTDQGCGGADLVTATATGAASVSAALQVAPPVGSSIVFVSGTPSDQAIVIQGSGGVGRSETATLTFRALDSAGRALPNELVTFALNPSASVSLQTLSAITDNNGLAVATVNSGTVATTFRVIASFAPPSTVSSISSTVTVTTGQPVQAAFSLSEEFFNIEGWSHDNEENTITILMADAGGNPVADGTPVVFQTDSGAVGTSSNGGCTTVNGGCSVNFRSQAPRYGVGNTAGKRPGLATISVSSSTSLVSLQGQIGMFLSGSTGNSATNVYLAGSSTPLSTTVVNALSTTSCEKYRLQLELNDLNFNPLPVGTTIAIADASADLTVGTISPTTVPNIYPHSAAGADTLVSANMAARQGSLHTIPITIIAAVPPLVATDTGCFPGGGTGSGTFDVVITSPLGTPVTYPFSLNYPRQ